MGRLFFLRRYWMVGISGITSGSERGIWVIGLWEGARTQDCLLLEASSPSSQLCRLRVPGQCPAPSAECRTRCLSTEDITTVPASTVSPCGGFSLPHVESEL